MLDLAGSVPYLIWKSQQFPLDDWVMEKIKPKSPGRTSHSTISHVIEAMSVQRQNGLVDSELGKN
jgi:hypothetical protein